MNWIDENIAIGNLLEANNVSLRRKQNIDLIVDVRTAFDTNARLEFFVGRQILNCERAGKISILLNALFNLKARVLVHCLEGIDRTPFIVMLYIAEKTGMNFIDAYHFVKEKRPKTRFHWHWVNEYEDYLHNLQKQKLTIKHTL